MLHTHTHTHTHLRSQLLMSLSGRFRETLSTFLRFRQSMLSRRTNLKFCHQ